jgi:nicotinate-nucleotide--dimethylbenzimidazole phosphoribosyltransferase
MLDMPAELSVGRGTGIDHAGLIRKQRCIEKALALHVRADTGPQEILRCLGGFEIAALVGAYIGCAQRGIPSLVDGFICTAAALVACRLNPSVKPWLLFSHCSAEAAHRSVLRSLGALPLLDLGLRLGEGRGAAVAIPIIQAALTLHREMATFAEAGMSVA